MINLKNIYNIEPLKLKHTEESKVFFVSDQHYGHSKQFLYEKRGFKSIEEHDITLISRWNTNIDNNSVVFSLGDFIFMQTAKDRIKGILAGLNFKYLFCMPGNHASGYKQLFNEAGMDENQIKYYSIGEKFIYFIPNYFEVIINGQWINLSHYPISSWNNLAQGAWHLHGHTHGSYTPPGKALDVGVEKQSIPLSFDKLKEKMDNIKAVAIDMHIPVNV